MFPNAQYGQHPLATTYPQSPRTSRAPVPADPMWPRHNSDAMKIHSVTDRDDSDHPGNHLNNNHNTSPPLGYPNYKSPEQYPNQRENEREYHGFRKGVYLLPCDDQEMDRLDIFHRVITEARVSDGLIYAPHPRDARVLDLGCGTGIWAIDVAKKYPDAFVVGVDLSPIQPRNHPRNCDFYSPWDYESPWASLGENYWDLIHLQMGCGSIARWPCLYRRVIAHLRPGGWFEQVEIDFEPRCDDRSLDNTSMREWYRYLKDATEKTQRPIAHSSRETVRNLQEAGFVDIDHQVVGLPLNQWHEDEHERQVGSWYNLAISESVETLILAPVTRVYDWPIERVRHISAQVKSEAFNKDIHAYNLLHIYQARKPAAN